MLYTFKCKQCGKPWYAACHEHLNYTEAGWEVRKRQCDSKLCPECFLEKAELKPANEQQCFPVTVLGGKDRFKIVKVKSADEAAKTI